MTGYLRTLACLVLGALVGFLLFGYNPVAHALPEYATRTGEPCATCHVNPAGGGARTVHGSLWVAAGKPDQVPPLPGGEAAARGGAPGAASDVASAGQALYARFGCAGCHGGSGESGAGPALNGRELPATQVSDVIRNGRGNMLAFKAGTLSDADLAALVGYVQAIGRGEVRAEATDGQHASAPAQAVCSAAGAAPAVGSCGGN